MSVVNEFRWIEPKEWEPLLVSVIPPEQQRNLVSILPQHLDVFEYLDDIEAFWDVYAHVGDREELAAWIPAHLRSAFSHVRMFHCCRPVDVKTYYSRGIEVLDAKAANDRFREVFLGNPRWGHITEHEIDAAIESMKSAYRRDGYVYFGLDDRELVQNCGHYLIYGSEYLQSLAARIGGKSELTRFGTPTIFAVRLPIEFLSDQELFELGEAALHMWAYHSLHPVKAKRRLLDFGIGIKERVPPELIASHYHPDSIPDPHRQRLLYRYKDSKWISNPAIRM